VLGISVQKAMLRNRGTLRKQVSGLKAIIEGKFVSWLQRYIVHTNLFVMVNGIKTSTVCVTSDIRKQKTENNRL
jgi:hypothetical protein